MDEINDLVLSPFREVVSHGTVGVRNAGLAGDERMLKTAQELVKEGERALSRLEALCQRRVGQFGASFVNALKYNEEISRFIEDLNNLLYGFEDFVETDTFDAEKVVELQLLSRKAAPRICNIILIRLEPAFADPNTGSTASTAAVSPVSAIDKHKRQGSRLYSGNAPRSPDDSGLDPQVKYKGPSIFGQEPKCGNLPTSLLHPRPRSGVNLPTSSQPGLEVAAKQPGSPMARGYDVGPEPDLDRNSSTVLVLWDTPSQPTIPGHSPNRASANSIMFDAVDPSSEPNRRKDSTSISSVSPQIVFWDSAASSASASNSRFHGRLEGKSYPEPVSPTPFVPTGSRYSPVEQGRSPNMPSLPALSSPASFTDYTDKPIEPVMLPPPALSANDGLIPVDTEREEPSSHWTNSVPRLDGCTITLSSSFSQYKEFCPGAMEVIHGGLGVKPIKKQVLTTANIEVAKCNSCAYKLEWEAVIRDINREASENFKSLSSGIGFRLRFFSKSHLPTKDVDRQTYGCLFCVQLRRTTHPNDATVFFSQQQLFAHLARHPRPLPEVPGLTVIEEEEMDHHIANNYDLHVPNPPKKSPLAALIRQLNALPTATALQTYRASPEKTDVLSFASGANLMGIKFPSRYQGQWCVGWADHTYGAIPAEAIQLDLPRKSDMMPKNWGPSSSSLRAVSRWRFSVKEKEKSWRGEWLSLNRGDAIMSIGWSHQDHWCWWGMNSKGKWGMFPQCFIEPGTLMEADVPRDRKGSVASSEKKSGKSIWKSLLH